jgi:hypothetical protein
LDFSGRQIICREYFDHPLQLFEFSTKVTSMLKSIRAQLRSRRYRTQRNTIEVLRFSGDRPSRVRASEFVLFHKPRLIRSTIFIATVSVVLIWALKNYIEIFRSILA